MNLPEPIITIFAHFQPVLTAPSYRKMVLLICGTLLARGKRTVTAALKMLGLDQEHNWPINYCFCGCGRVYRNCGG
jgi:hypothetical protein